MRHMAKAARLFGCLVILAASCGLADADDSAPPPAAARPAAPQQTAWDLFKSAQASATGKGATKDVARARQMFEQLMASDDKAVAGAAAVALARLASGELHDPALALRALERGMELGDAWSLFAIASIYDKGIGTKRNWAKARDYYEKALAQGGPAEKRAAAFALAQLYLRKPHVSSRRAAEYLETGRRNGDVWSSFMLAGFYRQGRGVEKSTATARRLYTEVRDGSDESASKAAAFELGRIYMSGPPRNLQLAKENFAFAAARKDVWSAYFLAEIYAKGTPSKANRRKARDLLLMVSKSDDPEARAAATTLLKRLR